MSDTSYHVRQFAVQIQSIAMRVSV